MNGAQNIWNSIADIYEKQFMDLDVYDDSYRYFLNALNENQREILELGCGPGNVTRFLLKEKPELEILTLDFAPNMVERAQKNVPEAKVEVGDAREISKLPNHYDAIVCGFILPYLSFDECAVFIKDAQHQLNSDGLLYISFVSSDENKSDIHSNDKGDQMKFYSFSNSWMDDKLSASGFEILKEFNIPYGINREETENHRILILKKIAF